MRLVGEWPYLIGAGDEWNDRFAHRQHQTSACYEDSIFLRDDIVFQMETIWLRKGVALILLSATCAAQNQPKPIQDNSFLVEEAYNQDDHVVQHISQFTRFWLDRSWTYAFTQEWPDLHHPRHQYSYTIAFTDPGTPQNAGARFGDVALNYRYQVVGDTNARIAFAPRFSVLLPTGDSRLARGAGALGIQSALPLSTVITRKLVMHWNAGATFIPGARDVVGDRANAVGCNVGQSTIWILRPMLNFMLENVWSAQRSVVAPHHTEIERALLLNPGMRFGWNHRNGLQIVAGIAFPQGLGPSAGEHGLLLYLSFEHPFGKRN